MFTTRFSGKGNLSALISPGARWVFIIKLLSETVYLQHLRNPKSDTACSPKHDMVVFREAKLMFLTRSTRAGLVVTVLHVSYPSSVDKTLCCFSAGNRSSRCIASSSKPKYGGRL